MIQTLSMVWQHMIIKSREWIHLMPELPQTGLVGPVVRILVVKTKKKTKKKNREWIKVKLLTSSYCVLC